MANLFLGIYMIKCEICNNYYSSISALAYHLVRIHKYISKEDYYCKYFMTKQDNNGICHNENCNNKTNFDNMVNGYRKYCSIKCGTSSTITKEKIKQTNMQKYGCENVFQSVEIKEKSKQTCLEKYGVDHCIKNKEIQEKIKLINLKRYGVEKPFQSKEIQNKIKQTNMQKYGVDHISKSYIIKNKILENYGVESYFQSNEIKEKIRKTSLERYGVDNPSKNKQIKEKIKQTCLERYGVEYALQNKEIKEKIKQNNFKKFFISLFESNRLKDLVVPLFTEEEYNGIKNQKYNFKCIKCNHEFEDHLRDGRIPRCLKCFPLNKSQMEINLLEQLRSFCNFKIIESDRSVLNGKELDIYIPEKNLSIEFNGNFWHSELNGKDKNYHLQKTKECEEKGIQLIHIFEDEWIEKQEIVLSILKSKLGLIENKIMARKCELKEVPSKEAKLFLFDNHLQGEINGKHLGLYYNEDLVSILSYGKPRFNKNYDIEILRFCNKINTIVIGGFSKLINQLNNHKIISYVDRRYGNGKSYINCGFEKVGESIPGFFYLDSRYDNRYNRIQFQKYKLKDILEEFDSNLTAWQNMQLSGYDRIWDCGNLVYSLKV